MIADPSNMSVLCFGVFELDLLGDELRTDGLSLKLRPQASKLLSLLACHEGQLVTREDIRQQIWNRDTFVDFNKSINLIIREIRAALGDSPNSSRYIQTVYRRGYRFIAPVQRVTSPQRVGPLRVEISSLQSLAGKASKTALAVLPFQDLSGDSRQEHLADGMTEILINELSQVSSLRVISRTSVMHYKNLCKRVPEIAKELEADAVVEGAILRVGTHARVTVRLVDAATDQNLWASSYEQDGHDIMLLQNEVGRIISDEIRMRLAPGEWGRPVHGGSSKFEVYRAYVKGLYYWNKRTESGLKKGIEYFEQAIKEDPNYALAYAAMADCYVTYSENGILEPQEAYRRAKAAALKALELNPTLAEAHSSLAHARMMFGWEWQVAERGFRRAIEFNPHCPTAHQWYADCLTALGRHSEALAEIEKAWELDPSSLMINADVGWNLCYAQRYDQAIEHYRKLLDIAPSFSYARWGLGETYLQRSMFEEAIRELRRAVSLSQHSPRMTAALAHAYAVAGRKHQSLKLLAELKNLSKRRYVPAYEIAMAYLGLDNLDEAFSWFRRAYAERSAYIVYIKTDPRFAQGDSDPRLHKLVARLGLAS